MFYTGPSSLLVETLRENEMDSGVSVQLFIFSNLESKRSSKMNEFEENRFPELYLPNK